MSTGLVLASVALPFVLSPGASFAITVKGVVNGDRWSGLKVWAGTAAGVMLIAVVLSLTGLGTVVANGRVARTIFGALGGAVLVLFGILTILRELQSAHAPVSEPRQRLILWSFLALVTNAKALGLYVLVVPTISRTGLGGFSQYMCFAAVHILMLFAWLVFISVAVRRIPGVASSRPARVILSALAAAVMVTLGVRALVDAITGV